MAIVQTFGRGDWEDDLIPLFTKSEMFTGERQMHHPFLVFVEHDFDIENPVLPLAHMQIVRRSNHLLEYSDETWVMAQWQGTWRSDWFQFQVRDLKRYLESKGE